LLKVDIAILFVGGGGVRVCERVHISTKSS